MSTLFVTMSNLRNELMKKYGNNRIFLKEIMNSDEVMVICFNVGGNYDSIVGEVVLTDEGWTLGEFNHEVFEMLLDHQKSFTEIGVLN
jgi:hypothetical protein